MTAKIRELISNMRALREAATPGPWRFDAHFFQVYSQHLQDHEVESAICNTDVNSEQGDSANETNAAFIAASPENQARLEAALLVAVEALDKSTCRCSESTFHCGRCGIISAIESALRGEPK